MRLIDADKLEEIIQSDIDWWADAWKQYVDAYNIGGSESAGVEAFRAEIREMDYTRFLRAVKSQPTVECTAHWIHKTTFEGVQHTICSNCKTDRRGYNRLRFCPDCGARMEEEENK